MMCYIKVIFEIEVRNSFSMAEASEIVWPTQTSPAI